MKRLAIIVCVMCVLVQPLSKQGIYLLYLLNKNYIARELCEQRAIPGADCQGKCHLRKELKKDAEREKQAQRLQQTVLDMIIYQARPVLVVPAMPESRAAGSTLYLAGVLPAPDFSFFHPPRLIA